MYCAESLLRARVYYIMYRQGGGKPADPVQTFAGYKKKSCTREQQSGLHGPEAGYYSMPSGPSSPPPGVVPPEPPGVVPPPPVSGSVVGVSSVIMPFARR